VNWNLPFGQMLDYSQNLIRCTGLDGVYKLQLEIGTNYSPNISIEVVESLFFMVGSQAAFVDFHALVQRCVGESTSAVNDWVMTLSLTFAELFSYFTNIISYLQCSFSPKTSESCCVSNGDACSSLRSRIACDHLLC
jgi:hypothetical protein